MVKVTAAPHKSPQEMTVCWFHASLRPRIVVLFTRATQIDVAIVVFVADRAGKDSSDTSHLWIVYPMR